MSTISLQLSEVILLDSDVLEMEMLTLKADVFLKTVLKMIYRNLLLQNIAISNNVRNISIPVSVQLIRVNLPLWRLLKTVFDGIQP